MRTNPNGSGLSEVGGQPVSGRVTVIIDGVTTAATVTGSGLISELAPTRSVAHDEARWTGGFIDLHSHGAAGFGYDDASVEGLSRALQVHRAHGTTGTLLSLVSASPAVVGARLQQLREVLPDLPGVVGVHLEGPFLAPERRGAHDPGALTDPTPRMVDVLLEAGINILRAVTIAPELPGALDAVERFHAAGVVVAVGHTQADYATSAAAFDLGASLLTHTFNAMPGLGHREPGPIAAAMSRDHVTMELIADGFHVHPAVIRMLFAAAPGRVALVSDAMSATGLGDGAYRLGGLDVQVTGGRPVLTGTNTLAGSTLTLDRAVEVTVAAGVPVDEVIAAATRVPARVLGLPIPLPRVGDHITTVVALAPDGRHIRPELQHPPNL